MYFQPVSKRETRQINLGLLALLIKGDYPKYSDKSTGDLFRLEVENVSSKCA